MGENTKIEWCDHTFNPWIGCTAVSPACDHCYAERYGKRIGVEWGPHGGKNHFHIVHSDGSILRNVHPDEYSHDEDNSMLSVSRNDDDYRLIDKREWNEVPA